MSKELDDLIDKIGDLHPRSSGLQRQGDMEDVAPVYLTIVERDLVMSGLARLKG